MCFLSFLMRRMGKEKRRSRCRSLPGLPANRIAFHVHNSDNKNGFVLNLINDTIRKFVGDAASGSMGNAGPSLWKRGNPVQRSGDFSSKFISQTGTLNIIKFNGFEKFLFRMSKDNGIHFVLSSARTAEKGRAVIFPALKPSRRDSASSAHN